MSTEPTRQQKLQGITCHDEFPGKGQIAEGRMPSIAIPDTMPEPLGVDMVEEGWLSHALKLLKSAELILVRVRGERDMATANAIPRRRWLQWILVAIVVLLGLGWAMTYFSRAEAKHTISGACKFLARGDESAAKRCVKAVNGKEFYLTAATTTEDEDEPEPEEKAPVKAAPEKEAPAKTEPETKAEPEAKTEPETEEPAKTLGVCACDDLADKCDDDLVKGGECACDPDCD